MKNIFKKYGYAIMSVSMILLYFVITGGVTATTVTSPGIRKDPLTSTALTVGQPGGFYFLIDDKAEADTYKETVCNPIGWEETTLTITPEMPVLEYCVKDNSPGIPLTGWAGRYLQPSNIPSPTGFPTYTGNFHLTFNTPGLKTVYVRSKVKRKSGESAWAYDSVKVNVTGTAPLPLKKYTFMRLLAEYRDASGGTISATQVIFTDPANQYFELKGDDKIDMVFKWKPSAADIQAVPDFETNYDIRDLNKTYQVLNKAPSGTTPFWSYKIIYDETRVVEFEFIEDALNGNLYATKPAKAGNGTTIRLIFQFRK